MINTIHGEKTTDLHIAAHNGLYDACKKLLNNDIVRKNINILDENNRTALHALAMADSRNIAEDEKLSSFKKIINLLFKNGINYNIKDINNDTALDIAEKNKNIVIANKIKLRIAIDTFLQDEKKEQSFIPGFTALQPRATSTSTIEDAIEEDFELVKKSFPIL